MNKHTSFEILTIIEEVIPNPKCELEYSNMFELICAVMLSAQTTDKRVNIITKDLFYKYPNPMKLANASYEDVYNIIKSIGLAKNKANNLLALAKMLHEKHNDIVPNTLEELMKLPGVGRKTASVVLAEGFKIPAMPVDTHLHRMAIRLGYIKKNQNVLDAENSYKKYIPRDMWIKAHHLLLLYGRYYCKATSPSCNACRLKKHCKEMK